MAGTDRTQGAVLGGPSVVLVRPQLGENIGAAARAMLNFGLTDLRLVAPRDGWPSDKARAAASGADDVVDRATVFRDLPAALADLHHVYATTARPRDMLKPVLSPEEAAGRMRAQIREGQAVGVLFGPEKAGLDSDDVARADVIVAVPLNPAFSSLNLAQAVLLMGYEWFLTEAGPAPELRPMGATRPANRDELDGLFGHLETELEAAGFMHPPEKAPRMKRNLRNLFLRAGLTEQEVRTLRGVIAGLARRKGGE